MESLLDLANFSNYYVRHCFLQYPIAFPLITCLLLGLLVLVVFRLCVSSPKAITDEIKRELKNKVDDVKDFVGVGTRPRFRKRDKIYFYGCKMLRKVKANIPTRPVASRLLAKRLARKLLGRNDRDSPQLEVIEPPAEYLQEDLIHFDPGVPAEFIFMLRNIRVFGHFEMPLFLELCKSVQTIHLYKGQTLFCIGQNDENIFIIQSGRLKVFVTEPDGTTLALKEVLPGESIISLLSFCDNLTGHPQPYKTVEARAEEDSIVMKFPVKAFEETFRKYPDMFVRVVQIIMVRLMRVTFMALHQYLGLSSELINKVPRRGSGSNMAPTLSSPGKVKRDSGSTPDGEGEEEMEQRGPETPVRQNSVKKIVLVDPKEEKDENSLRIATEKFQALLHLESDEILQGAVAVRDVPSGSFLMKQDSMKEAALVYILSGTLTVSQYSSESAGDIQLFTAHPGDLVGGLAVLSGDPSFFSVRAKHTARVATITKETFYAIIKETPEVVLHVANTVIRRMSPFVRQIDFALDWEHLEAGRALYKQGQPTDSTFIVLSGRLRSVITHTDGRKEVVAEYGKGDLVGIVELLTQTDRSTTVMAVRDSELAKLPEGLFNIIKLKYPVVMTRLIKLLGQRLLGSWKSTTSRVPLGLNIEQRPSQSNYSTVAIVPVSEDVPISQFTLELYHSLLSIGPALRLTSEYVVRSLGTSIWESANEYQLISWLGHIEDQHRVTLYQCDSSLTVWAQRCIRQADVILTVGLADAEPQMGKIEKHVEKMAVRTQKVLILLHREDGPPPSGTVRWLNMRSWCQSHHHIRAHKRMFQKRTPAKIIEYYTEKVFTVQPNVHSDFSRLARVLTGTTVGLVLGGGGARGAAHIGMIKAIKEVGIPIDMVAGVSIGAFIGALYCLEKDTTRVTQKAREWSMKMTSIWRMALDLTYPEVSMFSGAGFNKLIHDALGDTNIEDLWLPYFTLTTDITDSAARIHTHGVAWRYVRASMSIAMLVPPMPDPVDGHLLVDGCYINNVPGDVMHNKWSVGNILAIDVGCQYDTHFTNYGDCLSGWSVLFRRVFPFKYFFRKELKVPNLYDIQSRLSYVSCTRQLEELKVSDYCEYIRPPIDKYQTLQFGSFDEIKEVGYQHGKSYFSGMLKGGRTVDSIYQLSTSTADNHWRGENISLDGCPANFTDLAQIVCSVRKPTANKVLEDSSTEYDEDDVQGGYASEPNTNTEFFNKVSEELSEVRRRRTGSLSDNDIIELDHAMAYDDREDNEYDEADNEDDEE
ncbi:patatin-like phospholipase domain-containing protein 6 isoform X2 [Homarus americanus]|uniref:patatin-like phospholipase domain-containing protein 6 isoform X2 n=1 Tax=Homarus americanus TaxID=6706 RepID=UPI001C47A018|nr:patatin-like phospholipase domain-containing protein 6 isoform X2 [Homarus americanus]